MQELQDEQHRTEEKLANAKYRIDEIKDALRNVSLIIFKVIPQ
jgi:hypothetical protein